jgi:alkylation response protein AidB-like acyl-CoA dehydrogenase
MSFTFSAEQEQLRTSVRRFLAEKSTSADVRRLMDGPGNDPAVWARLTGELGLAGLAVPEDDGGAGCGPVELGIVLEEMGRVLLVGPYFGTVALAAQALAAVGDETARKRWLPSIADGSLTATVAVADDGGTWTGTTATAAESTVDGWALTGTKMFVLDGDSARLLLVVAAGPDGPGLFAVEPGAPGVQRSRLDALDPTRRLGRVELTTAPASRVDGGDGAAAVRRLLDLALVALAAEQVGGAQRCLDMAVDYAKVRVQFGRPIGSFQAIKHKCADMLLAVESARSAAYHAAAAASAGDAESSIAAALAKAYCSEAYTAVAKENIQIHGGIGYTWEHDAHLYLKRAKSSELLFGGPAAHRDRLADLVGI